jgi:glycerophosphoryl diester phosphodiesterase
VAKVTVLGHRGTPIHAHENTIAAFLAARDAGADGVELDVRAGPDGRLLIHHDPLPDPVPEWVPTLEEALDACRGMRVNVEVKNLPTEPDWDPSEVVARAAARLAHDRGDDVIVSAFTLTTIDAARGAEPRVPTGWLTPAGYDQLAAVATVAERGHAALHPYETAVTQEVVDAAHAAGLEVITWTVDDPARMLELASMGVDTIITNRPDLAVRTLGRH